MKNIGSLQVTTPTDREIALKRTFDAPRDVVWDAITKPELLKRWLFGPPGWEMTVCDEDVRVGGAYRWAWRGPDGKEMAMHGVYREVVPPEPGGAGGRIVRTETFDFGCESQGGEQIGTLVLAEQGGKTVLTLTVLYPSKQARDATIASGMEQGIAAGYDRLEEILAVRR